MPLLTCIRRKFRVLKISVLPFLNTVISGTASSPSSELIGVRKITQYLVLVCLFVWLLSLFYGLVRSLKLEQ